jgi:hypothetical protein
MSRRRKSRANNNSRQEVTTTAYEVVAVRIRMISLERGGSSSSHSIAGRIKL